MLSYKHEMADPKFENMNESYTKTFQSNFQILLVPRISSSLKFNEKDTKTHFTKGKLETYHKLLDTRNDWFLKFNCSRKWKRNHQMKLTNAWVLRSKIFANKSDAKEWINEYRHDKTIYFLFAK